MDFHYRARFAGEGNQQPASLPPLPPLTAGEGQYPWSKWRKWAGVTNFSTALLPCQDLLLSHFESQFFAFRRKVQQLERELGGEIGAWLQRSPSLQARLRIMGLFQCSSRRDTVRVSFIARGICICVHWAIIHSRHILQCLFLYPMCISQSRQRVCSLHRYSLKSHETCSSYNVSINLQTQCHSLAGYVVATPRSSDDCHSLRPLRRPPHPHIITASPPPPRSPHGHQTAVAARTGGEGQRGHERGEVCRSPAPGGRAGLETEANLL